MAYEKLSLNGRVAVVVGGTTGIGSADELALAGAFLASGSASVVKGEILAVNGRILASGAQP